MIIMQLNDVGKSFGAETILENIKMEVQEKDRIAVVGRNGSGKSTLLQIMNGMMEHDTGDILKPKDVSTGYLSQHTGLESDKTIWDEMLSVFETLLEQENKLRRMEQQMGSPDEMSTEAYNTLLEDYDNLQHAFEKAGGYHYEADIKAVLTGLNFGYYDYDTPIQELSGGQKTRLALGRLLLAKPDLLILDEPTNHLDIDTLGWLEDYLNKYEGAVVIVSHDRYFLDKTVSIIYEISRHHSKRYNGSYSQFLEQRALDYERELKAYEEQQSEIKEMEDFIQRNIARASTSKRAQSRRKELQKMEKLDKPQGEEGSARFSFTINRPSGNDVLKIRNLAFQYEESDHPLFTDVNFDVNRGERIALIGPNGTGKSTLLKIILGSLKASGGTLHHGAHVQIGYFDQEQATLNSNKTVLHELWDEHPRIDEKDIRTVLGNFLFTGEDVLKMVYDLSGGEKARMALAKLMMQKANLLILDEPTNHLDIDSKEVLESALADFPGTIIFVSHDRYFINKITDKIVEMQKDGVTLYLGDYDYYLEKKQEEAEIRALEAAEQQEQQSVASDNQLNFEEEKQRQREVRKKKRRINELETQIEDLEAELKSHQTEAAQPEVYQDHERSLELAEQTRVTEQKIEQLLEEWTALQDDL